MISELINFGARIHSKYHEYMQFDLINIKHNFYRLLHTVNQN